MCPVCFATAALIAGGVTSTGGLAVTVMTKLGVKNALHHPTATTTSKEDRHGQQHD